MKVIGSRSRSREQKRPKYIFPQCKTSIGNNSGYIKHPAMKFVCSMGFMVVVDRKAWPLSLSRDWKWPRITKCTHSRVVDLRVEDTFVHCINHTECIHKHSDEDKIQWMHNKQKIHNVGLGHKQFIVIWISDFKNQRGSRVKPSLICLCNKPATCC